jgi:hypothetical protein
VQRGQGPGIFQLYRDLRKLFCKQLVVPETASWLYWAAPLVAFTAMLTVPILIPVLTNFPLPFSDMGDILGGGLILTLGSFMITLAGLDTASAYGGIGSSRAVMVAILAEPTLILLFVGISLLAKAMLPFVVNHLLVAQPAVYWSPTHLFLVAAFFVLLLVETDRLPIHSNTHVEVYMIDEGRILEYSGPLLALHDGQHGEQKRGGQRLLVCRGAVRRDEPRGHAATGFVSEWFVFQTVFQGFHLPDLAGRLARVSQLAAKNSSNGRFSGVWCRKVGTTEGAVIVIPEHRPA